jgi:hypothetical protein
MDGLNQPIKQGGQFSNNPPFSKNQASHPSFSLTHPTNMGVYRQNGTAANAMSAFSKLQDIRKEVKHIPGIKCHKDFDIAVEIGYNQKNGSPLTLKQLLLLDIASAATVRRHLNQLKRDGVVLRVTTPHDHRSAHFLLSETAITHLEECLLKIHRALNEG